MDLDQLAWFLPSPPLHFVYFFLLLYSFSHVSFFIILFLCSLFHFSLFCLFSLLFSFFLSLFLNFHCSFSLFSFFFYLLFSLKFLDYIVITISVVGMLI